MACYRGNMTEKYSDTDFPSQESPLMYQAIFEATGTVTMIVNNDTTIAMANQKTKNMTGYDPEELIGQSWTRFIVPESLAMMQKYHELRRTDPDKGPKKYEAKLINKQGEIRDTLISVNRIPSTTQSIVSILDITERNQAKEALKEETRKYRTLFESSYDGILLLDGDKIIDCNPEALKMFRCRRRDILGKTPYDIFSPPFQSENKSSKDLAQHFIRSALEGKPQRFEWIHSRYDGTLFNAEISLNSFELKHKPYLLATVRDVSERKKAEEELRQSEAKFRTLFEQSRDTIYISSKEGKINSINQAGLDLFGYNREEIRQINIIDTYVNPAEYQAFMEKIDTQGYVKDFDVRLKRKDSTVIDCLITAVPRYDENGQIIEYQGIIHDITKRKVTENALKDSEAKFRSLAENIPGVIYLCKNDEKCTMMYVSASVKDLTGYSDQDFTENKISFTDLYHPTDAQNIPPQINQAIARREPFHLIYRIKHKTGGWRWIEETGIGVYEDDRLLFLEGYMRDISDRKKQEEEYRKLFITVEQSPISILITDTSGNIEYVNPKFCEISGYQAAEVIGKNPRVLKTDHTTPEEYTQLWNTITKGNVWRGEFLNKRKNGELYWEDAAIGPIKDNHGKIVNFVGLKVDISQRKKAQEELRRIHDIYRSTIENSDGVPYQYSYSEKEYIFVGSGIEKLLGITAAEFNPRKLISMIQFQTVTDTDTTIRDPQEYARAFQSGKIKRYKMDIHVVLDSGETKWISDFATPLLDEKTGKIVGSLGILQDITDRKTVEYELQFRLQLERIVSSISTMFINIDITDIDSGIDKALQMIGQFASVDRGYVFQFSEDGTLMRNTHLWYESESLSQQNFPQVIKTEKYLWWMSQLRQNDHIYIPHIADMPESACFEKETFESQGIRSLIVVPIIYGEKLMGFFGLDTFTEEIIWNQEDIALLRTIGDIFANALKHAQEETDRQKIQNQLLQSQKMEAIGTLSGGIAHDFNNLLTVIQGHTQLIMLDMNESSPHYRELKQIINATTRAANLTRQLLLFSRKQSMEFAPVNINKTITNLLKMIKRLIGENISITTKLEDDIWSIEADEGNIEQVIMNIAVNARDAMPQGGRLIIQTENCEFTETESKLTPDGRAGRFVRISIEDTGTGIPPEILKNIFEPFFSTKETGKGTGLGLSVVYGIVKKHNGQITVSSEVGKGTIFKIYIPATTPPTSPPVRKQESTAKPQGNGERILLIEDEEGVRQFTATALRQLNYIVMEAPDAASARTIFSAEKGDFDLIISDVVLPDTNGYELMEELLREKPDIPVVMCSGYSEENIRNSVINKKKHPYIQKPFKLQDLYKVIAGILDKD